MGREYHLWSGKFHKNIFIYSFHLEYSLSHFLLQGELGTGSVFPRCPGTKVLPACAWEEPNYQGEARCAAAELGMKAGQLR